MTFLFLLCSDAWCSAESLKAADMQTLSGEHFEHNLRTFVGLVYLSQILQGKSWNFIAKTD